MKYVLILLMAILVFFGALVGALAATGNLNQDAFQRLMGAEPEVTETEKPEQDPLDPIARQLRRKQEDLDRRETEMVRRESELRQRESDLAALQQRLETLQDQLLQAESEQEQQRLQRIETVANTIAEMKPDAAAKALQNNPIEFIVDVLRLMKDKDRGKVVEAMEPDLASEVLRRMQE